ncbi:hypothetical protein CYLTODRAFT_416107 [Cylindrobasidium torrendii FP15055 ss-10]|uniref:Uncharacterized protein n=1 Tax=Cylindrobasidium torrendii FP15055 ss-10 TaxID=1314674 RepID=A0A0D7BUT4_9AGAR|nr:hypothetical protein CYLTODRAFT_416107 [Cylindrobasidium torrendii FP15055 ss-10]
MDSNLHANQSAEPEEGQHDTPAASSSSAASEEQTNSAHDTSNADQNAIPSTVATAQLPNPATQAASTSQVPPSIPSGPHPVPLPRPTSFAAPSQEDVDNLKTVNARLSHDNRRLSQDNNRFFHDNALLIHNNTALHHTNVILQHSNMVLQHDGEAQVAAVREEQEYALALRQHELQSTVRCEIDRLRQEVESLRGEKEGLQQENQNLRNALRGQMPNTPVDRIRAKDDNNRRLVEEANVPNVLTNPAVPQILPGSGARRRTRPVVADEGEYRERSPKRTRP